MRKTIQFTEEVPVEEIIKYPGEYYAVVRHRVIAHGKHLKTVQRKAKKFSSRAVIGIAPTHKIVAYG